MDWVTFLSSSALAVMISWFVNYRMSLHNYKQEYYKQLIAKRISAYDAVEIVIKTLDGKVAVSSLKDKPERDVSAFRVHTIFISRKNFLDFFVVLINAKTQSVWLSTETTNILGRINEVLLDATTKSYLEFEEDSDAFYYAGMDYIEQLDELKIELFGQIRNDLRNLHDIEAFIKI